MHQGNDSRCHYPLLSSVTYSLAGIYLLTFRSSEHEFASQ